jgi:cytochrome c556
MRASICAPIFATLALAQTPTATMKQLMVDMIHPASNDILLAIYRGGPADSPADDKVWATLRRNALTLAEAGKLLAARNDQSDWKQDAKLLADAGTAVYKAAQAKDWKALASLTGSIDAACTTCHKQYRPDVFPREGGSK